MHGVDPKLPFVENKTIMSLYCQILARQAEILPKEEPKYKPILLLVFLGSCVTKFQVYQYTKIK